MKNIRLIRYSRILKNVIFREGTFSSAHSPYNKNCMYTRFSEYPLLIDGTDTWRSADLTKVSHIFLSHTCQIPLSLLLKGSSYMNLRVFTWIQPLHMSHRF